MWVCHQWIRFTPLIRYFSGESEKHSMTPPCIITAFTQNFTNWCTKKRLQNSLNLNRGPRLLKTIQLQKNKTFNRSTCLKKNNFPLIATVVKGYTIEVNIF